MPIEDISLGERFRGKLSFHKWVYLKESLLTNK